MEREREGERGRGFHSCAVCGLGLGYLTYVYKKKGG